MWAKAEHSKTSSRHRPQRARIAALRPARQARRGSTLLEIGVAIVLLAALLVVSVKGLAALSAHQRSVERRGWATQTAASVMEQATARDNVSWDVAASDDFVEQFSAAGLVRDTLPGGRLAIDVVDFPATSEAPASRKINVVVNWHDRAGMPVSPVRLSTWVYPSARVAGATAAGQAEETTE